MAQVKKVFVIHKTHLDIGFTDLAQTVMDTYLHTFIPQAIETARICNRDGKKNFVWTVGSYLIRYYLDYATDAGKLREAIARGDIAWHGLAVTTHTELMEPDVLEYDLSLFRALDKEFGRTTISAKMTDVPGHTAALVPYLVKNGIRYLHLGCNGSSRVLGVPPLSRLRYGEDEVILHYAGLYGAADVCGEYALEFAHTSDNMGPPTPERVESEMARLAEKYPGAEIVSGTMDEFALAIEPYRKEFPVVDAEPGDTWIHGVAGDPWKIGAYKEVLRAAERWKRADPTVVESATWQQVMENAMLVCEHTWGCDSKRWLSDYKNWGKTDFVTARQRNFTTEEDAKPAGDLIYGDYLTLQTRGKMCYEQMERSWEEQRDYVRQAIAALPEPYRSQAETASQALLPKQPAALEGKAVSVGEAFSLAGYTLCVGENGAVTVSAGPEDSCRYLLGDFVYQVFDAAEARRCFERYNRDFETTAQWAEPDFSKPGLQHVKNLQGQQASYRVRSACVKGNSLQVMLAAPEEAAQRFGAPRTVCLTYTFEGQISLTLEWFDKDASRIPEGVFLGFSAQGVSKEEVRVEKLGLPVNPYRICPGGNTRLHAVTGLQVGPMAVQSHHAPVLSVGGAYLYDVEETVGAPENGMYYLLWNNRWGTNFPLWYGDNARFDFTVMLP